jgi:hypothetical protein
MRNVVVAGVLAAVLSPTIQPVLADSRPLNDSFQDAVTLSEDPMWGTTSGATGQPGEPQDCRAGSKPPVAATYPATPFIEQTSLYHSKLQITDLCVLESSPLSGRMRENEI